MPRPGPRPYECVRRAWHSERHHPMRGSVIRQIFRFATDAHTPATKNNREWQEKLPTVVLKAEEIIYSKANSEAEYLNPDTLWDRISDAINTIIRRDETTESGELLPPCVEAALNLGCKPVRTSRSDRHNNPRTYLSPRTQYPASVSPKLAGANPLSFVKVTDPNQHTYQNNRVVGSCSYPTSHRFPAGHHRQPLRVEMKPSLQFGSVYPLYYGYEAKESQLRTTTLEKTCSDTVFDGRPVISPVLEPSGIGLLENLSYGRFHHVSNPTAKETAVGTREGERDRECDLSLRLGQCLQPCSSSKTSTAYETEGVGLGVSHESSKSSHLSLQRNKEYSFYPRETGYDTIYSNSTKYNVEGEDRNLEENLRKRKAPLGNKKEDGQFCRQLGVPSSQFTGRIQGPGS